MVGAAKTGGAVSSLFPGGEIEAAPYYLVDAVNVALVALSYFEVPEDERPPRNIWHHPKRLEEWHAAVKQARADRLAGRTPVPAADSLGETEGNSLLDKYR